MGDKIFVGVDLHKTQFTICIMMSDSILEEGTRFEMNKEGYKTFISLLGKLSSSVSHDDITLAIESTANSRFFRDLMTAHGFKVVVVNTLRFKVVNLSTKKTDKNDARTLAEFLAKDILPTSHLCSAESEALRRILKSRNLMVRDAVALKNQAHAILLAFGRITKPAQFQSKRERDKVLEKIPSRIAATIEAIFNTIDTVERQKKVLEIKLRSITSNDKVVNLLMTIPGIGIVNACTIRAYIDDIDRFDSYKNFSAYCGLVPWVQTSNETVYYGKITKRGPQELRTALVQCVVAMVRMADKTGQFSMIRQYQELKQTKSSGKAIIATARKLSRIIYVMLKTNTPFNGQKLAVEAGF
ncbi:MAG: IS110 family transposase [Spirochaetales bacterium]|nr:IS110 family transposase [Spirochaetales bacterium]